MPRTADGKRAPPRPPSSSSGSQNVALGECDVSYQSDLVRVDNLPVVDMWSPEEDHVWGALDEATCHSKAWGELAEDRLKDDGLTFPWIDSSANSVAKLGSSTNTLGSLEKPNLPFCIHVGEDSLAGAMRWTRMHSIRCSSAFLLRQSWA